jgi:hypothetical protein
MVAAAWTCWADLATPAANGFAAVSSTFYVNTNADFLNIANDTEHPGVDIAANGNIMVGWENDGDEITDFEAVWTLYGPTGTPLTPLTLQTNRSTAGDVPTYETTTNPWLSFFRDDDTAIGGYTGWGGSWPKANRFGNGLGWSAMCWEIGLEISELFDINMANGAGGDDAPYTQLLNNDGTPLRPGVINGMTNLGILAFTVADVTPDGSIRCGEIEYLSSGNIAVVGESRQADDWALTGQTSGNVPVYRVWTPGGLEVHTYAAASSERIGGDIYRGVGVTANGFAIRWGANTGGSTIRLFDNAGNPVSTNINLATLTGHPEVAGGGDGGGCGFHGNGVDAYVWANSGGSPATPWVTVINADGTLRWSREVQDDSDPIDDSTSGDVDGAIDASGRVIAVFSSPALTNGDNVVTSLVQARMFDKAGNPLGPKFVVSETESQPADPFAVYTTETPRVAWRGNNVVFIWLSKNSPTNPGFPVLAARILAAPITVTSVSRSGTTTTINWTGGKAPYSLRQRSPLTGTWSTVKTGIAGNSTTYTDSNANAYYQVLCSQ